MISSTHPKHVIRCLIHWPDWSDYIFESFSPQSIFNFCIGLPVNMFNNDYEQLSRYSIDYFVNQFGYRDDISFLFLRFIYT